MERAEVLRIGGYEFMKIMDKYTEVTNHLQMIISNKQKKFGMKERNLQHQTKGKQKGEQDEEQQKQLSKAVS